MVKWRNGMTMVKWRNGMTYNYKCRINLLANKTNRTVGKQDQLHCWQTRPTALLASQAHWDQEHYTTVHPNGKQPEVASAHPSAIQITSRQR
jgi:hypothetical protein